MALGGTNFKLKSPIEEALTVKITTAADKDAGTMEKYNDIVGVWVNDSDSGDDNVLLYDAARIEVPCVEIETATLSDYTVGSKVYFDETNAEVTVEDSGNTLCGVIVEAPAIGDETLHINLIGDLGITS